MDAEILSVELNNESKFLTLLSRQIEELRVGLEFCPACDEIYNELLKAQELTIQIYEIVSNMKSYKHMAEI